MSAASPVPAEPMARLRGLRVSLGGKPILKGIDADLERGSITAILGMNGAGKTTLLRAMLGEVPWTGELRYCCQHDPRSPEPGHIGYVPQRLKIEAGLPFTVLDLFGVSLERWPWFLAWAGPRRDEVEHCLAGVGMAHHIDSQVSDLSGGELQRVLLALALEPVPEILLLDEPAAGIDAPSQEGFYGLIGRLNRELGVTVVLVSHDLSMVSHVAGHVWFMKDGRIECQGPPSSLHEGGTLERIFGKQQGLYIHRHGE